MPKVIKRETSSMLCAKSSLSYGEDEEAIEITEISEECEDNLIMDEGILFSSFLPAIASFVFLS